MKKKNNDVEKISKIEILIIIVLLAFGIAIQL